MAPSLRDIRKAATKKRKTREEAAPVQREVAARIAESGSGEAPERSEAEGEPAHFPPTAPAPIDLSESPPEQRAQIPPSSATAPEAEPGDMAVGLDSGSIPSRKGKEVAEAEASAEESEAQPATRPAPELSEKGFDASFKSILSKYTRWAEDTLSGASTPEIQDHLRQQGSKVFFREAAVANLWAMNSFTVMKDLWIQCQAALDQSLEEIKGIKVRAETALGEAKRAEAESEAAKSRAEEAEAELELARRQVANAQVAEEEVENKLKDAESEVNSLRDRLHSATMEIRVVEERAENAEEIAHRSEVEIVALKAALTGSEERTVEAERKASEAEGKVAEIDKVVAEAIDSYKKSAAYDTELAETTAFAYEGGFRDCKEKIKRLFNLEGVDAVEPDDEEGDGPGPAEP